MLPITKFIYKTLEPCRENVQFYMTKYEESLLVPEALEEHKKNIERFLFDIIFDAVKKAHPDHYIVAGDEAMPEGQEHVWTVKLRGSVNHMFRGIDAAHVAIAHYQSGKLNDVLMTSPIVGSEFIASRGNGAQKDGKRIRVSAHKAVSQALVASNLTETEPNNSLQSDIIEKLYQEQARVISSGSVIVDALYTAMGACDLSVLNLTDKDELSEVILLAQESGALWGGFKGETTIGPESGCVLANPRLYKQFVTLTRKN